MATGFICRECKDSGLVETGVEYGGLVETFPCDCRVAVMRRALELAWPALRRCGYTDKSVEIVAIEAALLLPPAAPRD